MDSSFLQYLVWKINKLSKELGFIGGLGIALMVSCDLFYISTINVINQKITAASHGIESLALEQEISSDAKTLPIENAINELKAFKKILPQVANLHDSITIINQVAMKQKLILNRGDYKYSKAKQTRINDGFYLSTYEIVLPVTGQYSQIKQFISQALQLQPALALSELKMVRDNTLSPNVEARIVFVLYLQGEQK